MVNNLEIRQLKWSDECQKCIYICMHIYPISRNNAGVKTKICVTEHTVNLDVRL